ncbi:MAG TPA: hypothetical protein VM784_05845 [Actinomycetota bacterium]|nr:hypothetical protein [Actinomycetota bacterium]
MRINARLALRGVVFMLVAALVATVAVVLAAPSATANHGTAGLDARPETATRGVGTQHTIEARLVTLCTPSSGSDPDCTPASRTSTSGAVTINFENENGPNDPDGGTSLDTPDRQCSLAGAQNSCSMSYTGTNRGTDVWRVWIDHTSPDTSEGRNESTAPGTSGCGAAPNTEPDCTDVVEVTWIAGPPARLDCDDQGPPDTEREVNDPGGPGSNEVYNCFATDEFGNPVADADPNTSGTQNIVVRGEVENGVNDPDADDGASYDTPDYSCTISTGPTTTNPNALPFGQCNITVTQNELETGTAEICFWIGEGEGAALCANEPTGENQAADGSDTGNDRADQVEKAWGFRSADQGGLDAEPETATNPTGQNHTITATVYDQFGSPIGGNHTIKFEFFQGSPTDADGNTPNTPDASCTTGGNASCAVTYTSSTQGTDMICVWYRTPDPAMAGTSTSNPTCDGEQRDDPDDDPAGQDAPQPSGDRIDVVQKTWGPGGATGPRLDCEPETDNNPTGSAHSITCTARNAQNQGVAGVFIDVEATGANDPDNANSPTSPDFSCTTVADNAQTPANEAGTCSFTHGGGSQSTANAGTTTYRAWVDADNKNETTEADATEGRNETATPGATAEPDGTDVVEKTWQAPGTGARTIDCEPENDTNPTGTQHEVTCTVRNTSNLPVENVSVTFTETGVGQFVGDTVKTTDNTGRVRATTTSNERGTQTITGTLTEDTGEGEPGDVDECDRPANDPQGAPAGACSDSVTKNWGSTPKGACARAGAILGTDGDDVLVGTNADDVICGFGGNDTLRGVGGDDVLLGQAGDDTLEGGDGADTMKGGTDGDVLEGGTGKDILRGGSGSDTLKGNKGHDALRGGKAADSLRGGRGNDNNNGGNGRDFCRDNSGRNIFRSCENR